MRRRTLWLLAGVALPTLLLAAGWSLSSWRERESRHRERMAFVSGTVDAIQVAVEESLGELLDREDQRPFYLYNHYYSPPDVLAVSDPVAVSPLARAPEDPRVVGYFQVDPDGTLRTPYEAEPGIAPTERSRAVEAALGAPGFEPVRDLARGDVGAGLVPGTAVRQPVAERPEQQARAQGAQLPRVALVGTEERPAPTEGAVEVDAQIDLRPSGPLTTSLNRWGQAVYSDVSAAQRGDEAANLRVQARGRAAPQTVRNEVAWDTVQDDNAAQRRPSRSRARATRRRPRRPADPASAPATPANADPAGSGPALPVVPENEIQVDYTPMATATDGEATVLHRVVTHQGTAVVQGALIDRGYVFEVWIPEVAARIGAGLPLEVVSSANPVACSVRLPASETIAGADLCVSGAAFASVEAGANGLLFSQLGALFGLLFIVALAAFLIDRAGRRAEELSRQKSDFVSAVSHELRTPLTTIRMHAEMLREGMVSEGKRARFHDDLVGEAVRLSQLVDNVLELSRIEGGKRPMRLTEGDLGAFCRGVVEGQRLLLEDRGVTVRGPAEDVSLIVQFDRQAVEQILLNLLANAAKYGRGDDGIVDVELRSDDEGAAILSVLDRGPGIPADEREAVFERFHRVERESTAHMPGTGIGLALVRDLARAHGGNVQALPRDGGGLEVRVTLGR